MTDILKLIKATTEHFGHEFVSGDCGNFAIALATFLWNKKMFPVGFLVEYGSHYEMYDHVSVICQGVAYDGNGVVQRKTGKALKGYDEWNKTNYDTKYMELHFDDDSIDMIVKYTDSDAVFAHGSDMEKTLEFMRQYDAANSAVESLLSQ